MLIQSMGIVAALMFVLGLVAVAVWVAKKFGAVPSGSRARVPIEVVQRVSLGPKTGLAVVRVGEKVMAVSMGPDGMRPLFELDEADRQRVLASSAAATPFATSAEAGRAIGTLLPPAFARMFQRNAVTAPVSFAESMKSALNGEVPAPTAAATQTKSAPPESISAADRDFRSMLNMTLSGATRLVVFGGVAILTALSTSGTLSAQTTPPVTPPPVVAAPANNPGTVTSPSQPATQTAQPGAAGTSTNNSASADPAQTPTTNSAAPSALQVTPPKAPAAKPPAFVTPTGTRAPRTAAVRPASVRSPLGAQTARNGAQTPATDSANRAQPNARTASTPAANASRANRASAAPTAAIAGANDALANMLPQMDIKMGDGKDGGLRLSGTVGIVVMMGLLTLLPTLVLMMTGFTRILIVLHFLKQAMGTQSAPPAQLLAAMALLLTGFVMAPTLSEVNQKALTPWMDGKMTQVEMLKEGVKPMRVFMLKQTKEADLRTFVELSRLPRPNTVDDVPLHVLTSAFVASELRRAFMIGFMVYLPFIIIDAVVASVLMSMGMFMLPPAMISMPFKLLLFVLVDGWGLMIKTLINSFG